MRIPKYFRVKEEILDLIAGMEPDSAIPTERDLAERFSTSRTTVRRAITELVVEGRLRRVQGSGTFVARPKLMRVRPLTSFSQDLHDDGWQPGAVVLDVARVPASVEVAEHLDVDPGVDVYRVERLRTASGTPIAHETAHLPGSLVGLDDALARRGSLYTVLREDFDRAVTTVEDVVETILADPVEADLLGVETGLPLLLVHRTARDRDGVPVEWTRSVFRGDRFRFVATHCL